MQKHAHEITESNFNNPTHKSFLDADTNNYQNEPQEISENSFCYLKVSHDVDDIKN